MEIISLLASVKYFFLYLYSFVITKGFLFGIITSLPIGGAALLIIREAYVKGTSVATSLVLIPLRIDWFSTFFALFFFHWLGGIILEYVPYLGIILKILAHNINGVLGIIFAYIGITVWRESKIDVAHVSLLDVRFAVKSAAKINFFTIPAAILFVWNIIFGATPESVGNKVLFLSAMITGGISLWSITFFITRIIRAKKGDIDLQKTNLWFARVILVVALFPLYKESIHLFRIFKSLLM